jgi:hypothetical protein
MNTRIILAGLVVAVTLTADQNRPTSTQPAMKPAISEAKTDARRRWETALQPFMADGVKLSALNDFMAGKCRDRGAVHWGGTGARSIFYLVDDYHQLRADVDLQDNIQSVWVGPREPWLKLPDGTLMLVGH